MIFQDVTWRKRADLALRESEQRFRSVVHSTGAGYFRLDANGRFEDVNNAWLAIHGCENRADVIGQPFTLTQVEENVPAASQMISRVIGEHIKAVRQEAAEPLFVEADRGQLKQVLLNLAVNAADAMPGGGGWRSRSSAPS